MLLFELFADEYLVLEIVLDLFGAGLEEAAMNGSDFLDEIFVGGTDLLGEVTCRQLLQLHLNVLCLFQKVKHVVNCWCRILQVLYTDS